MSRRVDLPLRPDFLLELEEEARTLEVSSEGCDEGLGAERISVFSDLMVNKKQLLTQVVTWRDGFEKAGEIAEQQMGEQELCSKRWQLLYAVSLSFSAVS